ncbi:unnamed protein product [Linum trigynum]
MEFSIAPDEDSRLEEALEHFGHKHDEAADDMAENLVDVRQTAIGNIGQIHAQLNEDNLQKPNHEATDTKPFDFANPIVDVKEEQREESDEKIFPTAIAAVPLCGAGGVAL